MRFLFVVHKNEEKAEQNSVLFHRPPLKERGLRPNGYFPLMRQPLKAESGDNAFTLTPQQWIKATDTIGIVSKSGRYGGTYAHTDIAFEFASWISPEFKLYIIKDYQRLKKDEADRLAIG